MPSRASKQARASLGITRSNQYPNFGAGAVVEINRLSRDGATPLPAQVLPSQNRNFGAAALQLLSFEIDIWGRLRRATEAARANLLERGGELAKPWSRPWSATWPPRTSRCGNSTTRSKSPAHSANARGIAGTDQDAAERAASRRCSTCARPNNWCIPPRETIPGIAAADRADRESDQPSCSGENPGERGCAAAASPIRTCRRTFPPVCPRHCSSGVRISAPRSRI